MVLKAFSKSIFSKARLALLPEQRSNHARAVWTAASAPAGTATPTWAGKKYSRAAARTLCRKAFVSEPAQQLAYCYWPHPSFWLGHSHQVGPGQRWGGGSAGSPLGKEVDDCRELLQQPFPGSQEGVTEVLRTKTGRPRRGGGWKGVQCFEDIIW